MQTNIPVLLLLWTLLAGAADASAVCVDNRHPTVQKERRASGVIIEGLAFHAQDLKEDPSDLSGITATLYDVRVLHTKKGRVAGTIQVRSDNTTSRFPMQIGRSYILFLNRDGNAYTVDSCGNSGKIAETRQINSSIVPSKRTP